MRVLHVGHGFRPFHHGGLISYAEDLMDAQATAGDEVHYFFSGRHYPLLRPRISRWRRGRVQMHELLNSPVLVGPADRGTRRPDRDLNEATVERLFRTLLDRVRPELVHVQELGGLPSSLLEIPGERGVPVVMALRDYFPLCPTLKLFDADEQVCLRRDPAPVCVRCCRDAPANDAELVRLTLRHHKRQAARRLPLVDRLRFPEALADRMRGGVRAAAAGRPAVAVTHGDIRGFRARRDINVARLNRVDRLIPLSARVAQIYGELGVRQSRMRVMAIGPAHLDTIRSRRLKLEKGCVRFLTLNGCASAAKGAGVIADALDDLAAAGLTVDDLTLSIAGHVDPSVAGRLLASPLVTLLGQYPAGGLDALLDGYHVGIVPSVWEEAYGFVGVEMLAKGLPVIGNAVGGIVEYLLEGETGWLNRDRSGRGLARIMAGIVSEPQQIATLNSRILERRSDLVRPTAAHLGDLRELYVEVIGQSSSTARSAG